MLLEIKRILLSIYTDTTMVATMNAPRRTIALYVLSIGMALVRDAGAEEKPLDHFERHIRPLLIAKCVECHGGSTADGDLDLTSHKGVIVGGTGGKIVKGKNPDASALVGRLVTQDEELRMPPDGPLSEKEIQAIRKWIEFGLPWPSDEPTLQIRTSEDPSDTHWAFKPISQPRPPKVTDAKWCWNDLDRFVQERLEAKKIQPSDDAERAAWLRRVSLDLTGLPPTIHELEEYLNDSTDSSVTRVVQKLLGSRGYAERQARRWLDVARYADTSGDGTDTPIPEARFYRDWVIDAFAADMPYDQFLIEQLAGDILAKQNPDDPEAYRKIIATGYVALSRRFGNSKFASMHQIIDDTLDTVGKSMLGLSIGCARCHHHKFDPITTEDYYGLYGYFSSTQYPHAGTEHQKERSDLPEIDIPEDKKEEIESSVAWGVADKPKVGDASIYIGGDPVKKGPNTPRSFLAFLDREAPRIPNGSSGRLELARWIATPNNPLTARVIVNRIWQSHFGRGLIPNASNFGVQSPPPSHPELLDYLATELVNNGWSMKHIHRLIVTSHTYHLSSNETASQHANDEANSLYSHFPRQRMDAETFRDATLATSGRLEPGSGGRHPFPPTEKLQFSQGKPFSSIFDHERRSVYLMAPRLNKHPMLALFDGADANTTTASRGESTVPLQSLFIVNGSFVSEQAHAFAKRIQDASGDYEHRIQTAWKLAYARPCTKDESKSAGEYLHRYIESRKNAGSDSSLAEDEAWDSIARTLIASNEFIYID